MLKLKHKQSGIDRQIIDNKIRVRSNKLFEDPGIATPIFSPGIKGFTQTSDKVGGMPLEGGESPTMKVKKLEIQEDTMDYKTQSNSRLMLSSQMRGRGSMNYGSRISSIEDFKRVSIEHGKLADY